VGRISLLESYISQANIREEHRKKLQSYKIRERYIRGSDKKKFIQKMESVTGVPTQWHGNRNTMVFGVKKGMGNVVYLETTLPVGKILKDGVFSAEIGHELGHVALGHVDQVNAPRRGIGYVRSELAASRVFKHAVSPRDYALMQKQLIYHYYPRKLAYDVVAGARDAKEAVYKSWRTRKSRYGKSGRK